MWDSRSVAAAADALHKNSEPRKLNPDFRPLITKPPC